MSGRIRVGVLGAGYWASTVYLPALARRDDVELVVVSRRDGQLARRVADHFGARHATDDWEAAIAMGLDAVVVASPPAIHEGQVCAALRSGAHVLCEKPFAIEAEAAWRMVEASHRSGRCLTVAFGWNHMPFVQTARTVAMSESFGSLEWLGLAIRIPVRGLFVDGVAAVEGTALVPRSADTYVRPEVSGGGQLPGTMSHLFGMAMYITGAIPGSVFARVWEGPTGVDVHDAVNVGFVGGAVGDLSCVSTHSATDRVEWSLTAVGSKGQVQFDTASTDMRAVDDGGRLRSIDLPAGAWTYEPVRPLAELLTVAGGGRPSEAGAPDLGARTVEVVEAAYRSVASQHPESLGRPSGDADPDSETWSGAQTPAGPTGVG